MDRNQPLGAKNHRRRVALGILGGLLGLNASVGSLAQAPVTLTLRPNWNLVALPLVPADPRPEAVFAALISVNRLKAVWGYDPDAGWTTFTAQPPTPDEVNSLRTLVGGRGYFVELTGLPAGATVDISYQPAVAGSIQQCFEPGWNLAGFGVEAPTAVDEFLAEQKTSVAEIFRFNAAVQGYESRTPGGAFDAFERGRGYWLRVISADGFCTTPSLALVLEGDVDFEPTGGVAGLAGEEDEDLNHNGFIDDALHQDTLAFGRLLEFKTFLVRNAGTGSLTFTIAETGWWTAPLAAGSLDSPPIIQDADGDLESTIWQPAGAGDAPWLQALPLEGASPYPGTDPTIAFQDREITVLAGRLGRGLGHYLARLRIESSAGTRTIFAVMTVPPLTGEYFGKANVQQINGIGNAIGEVSISIELSQAGDRLSGVVRAANTLVFPQDVPLSGGFLETGNGQFVLSGSYSLPPKARVDALSENASVVAALSPNFDPSPKNPFRAQLLRDVTLVGEQLGVGTLVGEYHEVLRGPLVSPISLFGTFRIERRQPLVQIVEICGNATDDDGDGAVDEPDCVVLVEICDNGIDDDKDGTIDEAACDVLTGVKRRAVTGTVTAAGPVVGASVVLTGSHLQIAALSGAGGSYIVEGLLPGVYRVTAAALGYAAGTRGSRLFQLKSDGSVEPADTLAGNPLALVLEREAATGTNPEILASPEHGLAPLTVQFATRSPPGVTRWVWSFPGGNPTLHDGQSPPPIVYSTPGVHTATLLAIAGAASLSATRSIVVGPIAERVKLDGTTELVAGENVPQQIVGSPALGDGGATAGAVARNDTAAGANNASYLLIGSVGAALDGFLTGGRSANGVTHYILEVGPVAAVPPEVAK